MNATIVDKMTLPINTTLAQSNSLGQVMFDDSSRVGPTLPFEKDEIQGENILASNYVASGRHPFIISNTGNAVMEEEESNNPFSSNDQ